MAQGRNVKVFSFQGFDSKHYQTTEQYAAIVKELYDRALKEIISIASKADYNPSKPFSFADYPKTYARIQKIIADLSDNIKATINNGSEREWLFACKKNEAFLQSIMDVSKLSKLQLSQYQNRRLDALKSFQERKVNGMNLSERIWKYTEQYKQQIEDALDVGLGEGRSAAQLSRDVRQNLQDPDKLFRRIRDKRGNLHLSKRAKAYKPGVGKYRSSYKNAMRLTRSEINMAYRQSDWLRWQSLDFVIGYEIKRSNREPKCKCSLCERLKGKYPKVFKFVGWHPQCLCYAIPIMEDFNSEDRRNRLRAALYGTEYKKYVSPNTITDVPDEFKAWVEENKDRQAGWASTPYFIRDNFKNGNISEGLKFGTTARGETTMLPTLKAQRTNLKEWARNNLVGKSTTHSSLKNEIYFSMSGIKEFLNQPHKNIIEKNALLKDIVNVIARSKYMGVTFHKGKKSHIFEIEIKGEKNWIIVNENKSMGTFLYSITNSDKVLQGIKE